MYMYTFYMYKMNVLRVSTLKKVLLKNAVCKRECIHLFVKYPLCTDPDEISCLYCMLPPIHE